MPDKTDNHLPNPNFTQRHEEKIDAMRQDVTELQLTVYGSEKLHMEGLVKQVKTLKDGQKLLTRQNIIMVAVAITGIATVINAIYPFFQ